MLHLGNHLGNPAGIELLDPNADKTPEERRKLVSRPASGRYACAMLTLKVARREHWSGSWT